MTDKPKPRRLSETVIPGVDFPDKRKIGDVLEREVTIWSIEREAGSKEFALVDPETGEVIARDYWNVVIELDGEMITFSTGAIPIDKVFRALQAKLDTGEAELPLLATFRKEGRTYVVS